MFFKKTKIFRFTIFIIVLFIQLFLFCFKTPPNPLTNPDRVNGKIEMSSSDSTKIKDKLHDTTGNEISFYLYLTIPNLLDSVSIDILNEDGTNEFDTVFIIDPDDPYADTLIFSNIFHLPGVKKLEGNLFLNNGSIKPLPAKTITIAGKPVKITEQPPDSISVTSGEKVEFSVDVTGDEPILFQWFRNNLKLDDDTSKTLLIDSAISEITGKHYCVINNPYGPSVVSDTTIVTITGEPVKITEQPPDSITVISGEKVEFSVDVTGDEPITFQWFRNNLKLDDDTSKTLLIDSAISEITGKYYCVINNPYGPSVVSDTITVVVDKEISETPVVNDDSYSVKEDSVLVIDKSKGILVNDINPDGSSLKVSLIDSTQNGLLELNSDGSFIYTPSQDFFGSDSFTYKAVDSDNIESAEKATVRITVEPVNDKPVSKPDTFSVVQDAILKIVVKNKGVLNNDHDIDGDSLTAVLDSTVKYGKLEFREDGTFTYTPADGWRGTDYFYYHAVDDSGATSAKTKVTISVVNKEQPVSIGFENTESSVYESDVTHSIRVSLSAAMSKAVIVEYAVTGGSAESPDDYTLKGNGQLVFNEGDLVQDILISIKDDTLHEKDETIIITLSNSSSGVLLEDSIHTVTIIDNEMPGVFFDPESISVTEQDTTLLIMVKLQYPPRDSAVVTWSVTGGTATKGEDYNCNEKGKLVFRADETEKTIPLMIKDDSFKESSEPIEITLTEAAGAVVSSKHVFICEIIDNDELPEIGFRLRDSSGTEDIQLVLVDVILSSPAEDTVYVDYYVDNNSTAVRYEDYKLSDGTLVFRPGDTLKSINIEIIQDAISEPDETVIINLENPVKAVIGSSKTYTYTIKGDPSVFFKTTSGSDEEKNRTVAIPVILSFASQDTVKVDYKVIPGTTDGAVKGDDFELDDGTLIFNPGDISDTIHLKILDDNYYENDENLIIELKNAKNAMIKESAKEYVYTIKNDDLKPKIGFGTTSVTKNENNDDPIEIDVVLSDTSALEASVEYTFGGSADSGSDYTFIGDNPLVFAPFEMSKKLSMIIIDDGIYESRENIIITLGGTQNADVSTSSGVFTLTIPGDRHNVTVTSSDGGSVDISGTKEFAHDTVIAISPTAESNYQFVKWEYTQTAFDISGSVSEPNATFRIKGPGSIKAVFAINNFTVTKGTITGEGEIEFDPPDGPYPYGTELIVTAKPEENYKFDKWGGALSGSKNPDTLIIDENKTIRATFIRKYTLTVTVAGGQGSVTPEAGEYLYGAGEVVTLTRRLPSAPGWRFVGWSGDVSGNDSTVSVTMSTDRNVTATFEKIPVPDNVYCVNSSAEGSRTGTNWADAFTTIEEALEAEENSATVNTVWVAEGEYLPSGDSFFPKNGCTLLGGFEGNESTHSQAEKREWYNNITTLNGKNVNYLIDLYGNSNIAIEGFKLIKSMKNAIYINESKVTVNNCIFTNNGTDNATSRTIYITGDSTKILNCIFTNNLGLNGSCIYTKGENTIIGNTVIFDNSGPAIVTYVTDTLNQTKIINCSIIGNKSSTESGGINNTGLLTLINCIIYYNTGISTSGTQINKTNATQFCNIEDADGGGIGKKDPGYFPNNISTDPLFESLSMPSLDNIWFDPTDNNHALVPSSESSSKSSYGLSEFSEPTKYVKKDIRNRTRSSTYFMGAYERY